MLGHNKAIHRKSSKLIFCYGCVTFLGFLIVFNAQKWMNELNEWMNTLSPLLVIASKKRKFVVFINPFKFTV